MNIGPPHFPPFDDSNQSQSPTMLDRANKLVRPLRHARLPVLLVAHLALFVFIYRLAILARFESLIPENPTHLTILPLFVVIKLSIFYVMKTIHGWWRYVTFADFVELSKATFLAIVAFYLIDYLAIPHQISRAVILIDGAFTIAIIGGLRSVWRFGDEGLSLFDSNQSNRKNALMIGADVDSAKLSHLINSRSSLEFRIAALVATEAGAMTRFGNLNVAGNIDEISELCKANRASTIFVPAGKLQAKQMRELIDSTVAHDLQVRVVPSMMSLLEGTTELPVRHVKFEDLLRRSPVNLDQAAIRDVVSGKRILVTGAGGSIGSELCRQLLKFSPKQMVLLGRGENRLYHVNQELSAKAGSTELVVCLASITDERRMRQVFEQHKPELVFHAAAHKHVPLTEQNIGEAVINNVLGTKIVADTCDRSGVERCVMVSTDKAVNPTSIMGCTKQLAEKYCLALGTESNTKFIVTRFGNVLGSEGSVVPLFKKQITQGGPLTVTDDRMTRFFMTIPEAAQLVVQAGAMGAGGEIFVLEMGQPVKIVDLARDLIRLSGLPPNSIEIQFTGIRPGEKLYEELYYTGEESVPTDHDKILIAKHRKAKYDYTNQLTCDLIDKAYQSNELVREQILHLVPEFGAVVSTDESEPVKALR